MFYIKKIESTKTLVDLSELPISHWPSEAKEIARQIIAVPKLRAEYSSQLTLLRKDWLIKKIEAYQTLTDEFTDWLNEY